MNFEIRIPGKKLEVATVFDVDTAVSELSGDRDLFKTTFWLRYRKGANKKVQEVQKLVCA